MRLKDLHPSFSILEMRWYHCAILYPAALISCFPYFVWEFLLITRDYMLSAHEEAVAMYEQTAEASSVGSCEAEDTSSRTTLDTSVNSYDPTKSE